MPQPNPYEENFDEYLTEYEGEYDPLFAQKPQKKAQRTTQRIPLQDKPTEEGIIRKTLGVVKEKTEDVVDDLTSKQSLTAVAQKKSLSVIDYAILLSSVYGIGAAVGITTGAAKNITPNRKHRPKLYWIMVSLGVFGAYKGFQTATQYRSLRQQLAKESALEKRLSKYLPKI
jgi:hypothetical protein